MIHHLRAKNLLLPSLFITFFLYAFPFSKAYEPTRTVDLNDPAFLGIVEAGEELYKANCSSCHAINRNLTGPSLANVWERWGSEEDLIAWIRNNQAFLETGDPYAVNLYNEWNQSPMNLFLQFSDEQIISIIDYIRAYEPYTALKEAAAGGGEASADAAPVDTGASKLMLWILLAFLVLLFLVLGRVTTKLDNLTREMKGEEVPEPVPLFNRLVNKRVMGTLTILVILFLGHNIVKGAINLGRSQGYAPEQPIKFSHAIHAGQNQIDCQYCHTGVEKSKHAYIPSVTVCMNCHKYVQEGPKYGPDEIAKIYAASGWDVNQQKYANEPKPIEWKKIHNLPDHVYFSHAQHVKAGGLDCATCHGNIEEMEVVQQFAPLSMGWCVNCHRETDIKFTGNEYYETTFERFHNELKAQERSGVTVEEIGGTECQKCHY
jgi:mono/diheme cytochrome c family protein